MFLNTNLVEDDVNRIDLEPREEIVFAVRDAVYLESCDKDGVKRGVSKLFGRRKYLLSVLENRDEFLLVLIPYPGADNIMITVEK